MTEREAYTCSDSYRKTDFSQTIYVLNFDSRGYPYVETDTLENRVLEAHNNESRNRDYLFLDGKILKYVNYKGITEIVDEFDDEEEARQEFLERIYEFVYQDDEDFVNDYFSMDELLKQAAEIMDFDNTEVVKSLIHHNDIWWEEKSRRVANELMDNFYEAKSNANGKRTKALKRAYNAAEFTGLQTCYSRELCVKKYYTEEFKKELFNFYENFAS